MNIQKLTGSGAPENDKVGGHEEAAARVLSVRVSGSFWRSAGVSIRPYDQPETGVSLVGGLVEALVLRHRVLGIDETGECQRRISYDVMFGFGNGQLASYRVGLAVADNGAGSITRTPLLRRLQRFGRG